jgi:2-(1,2-epoxy-1,2-dihydrophenyl)acetyl-CoA isomerase
MADDQSRTYETLRVVRADGVVTLTVTRPEKKNAMNLLMFRELLAVFDDVTVRRDDRVLLITGEGDGFCSGADLTDPSAGEATSGPGASVDYMRLVGRCALRLHELPKPTVAAVNGVAAGAGCNLALGCDIVIASERARFIEIFSKRGLVVDFGGSWLLPRLVGLHRAKELIFLAESVDAGEAAEIGLVNRVVPADRLLAEARTLATKLALLPPIQLSITKRLLNQSLSVSMSDALEFEGIAQSLMFRTADTTEAMLAFAQKRDPLFRGE